MSELKPCPFCGNEHPWIDDIERQGFENELFQKWYVVCVQCGVRTYETDTIDEAIRIWNTRAKVVSE